MTLVVPRYSAPVAVADVLVVLGMATTNNAAVGKGIGKVAVRDEQYPHCCYAKPITITEYPRSPSGLIRTNELLHCSIRAGSQL